jgi:hypothetical protein
LKIHFYEAGQSTWLLLTLELVQLLKVLQPKRNYDIDALLFTGDFTMPVKFTGSGLNFVGKTESFLSGIFTAGSGGKFTATNALDYFLEVLAFILATQNDKTKNPDETKNITCSINATGGTINGSFTLPFTRVITESGITITPTEYLLT